MTAKKKILLISHSCQTPHEGQQRAQMLGELPGIDLCVLVPNRWNEYGQWRTAQDPKKPSYKFQVERVRWPWTGPAQWYLHHYPKLGKILRRIKPDIIDIWEEPWGLVSAHTCWLRNRLLPSAKILSETEANINRTHPFPFTKFRKYSIRNTQFAVARQMQGVEVLRSKGYYGPVQVVGNAVDETVFRPMDREICKKTLGLNGFVAGYVGRLVEEKGLMEIVEAAATCPEDICFLFVGSGPFQSSLESRIAKFGLSARIKFLPPRAMNELPEIMNAIDVLLLMSRTTATWKEQFGRVIIEAHACGTPVIGSDSGAIPEVIDQGGIVVPERQADALAKAIKRLSCSPLLGPQLGRRGRQQVKDRYTWRRVAERMNDIYLKMLEPSCG